MEQAFSFEQWAIQHFRPCCYVYSTDFAKKIIEKNNLSPSEFLRPFGDFRDMSIGISLRDNMTTINEFQLDFFDCDNEYSCSPFPKELYGAYLQNVFSNPKICPDWTLHDHKIHKGNKANSFSKLEQNSYPWFNEFERTLMEFLQFSPNEYLQQPLFNIIMCSCKDDPLTITKLTKEKLSSFIKKGLYDNSDYNVLILLNDKSDAANYEAKSDIYLTRFQNCLSFYNVTLWEINTIVNDQESTKDIWSEYLHKTDLYKLKNQMVQIEDIKYGNKISIKDQKRYKKDMHSIFYDYVARGISGEIIKLEFLIKEAKGGNYWFSKVDNSNEYISELDLYKLKDIDKKKIQLALYYFYFRDYEYAIATLKKIELKGKVYQNTMNCINHFIVICQFIISKGKMTKNEIEKPFRVFMNNNQKLHAFQSLLIIIRMHESLKAYDHLFHFIWSVIQSFSNNQIDEYTYISKWLSPLLYEKVANTHLFMNNSIRKFCLYMYYAGEKYCKIGDDNQHSINNKYSLHSYGFLFNLIDTISPSFLDLKRHLNYHMSQLSKKTNYPEAANRFYKNSIELYTLTKSINKKRHNNDQRNSINLIYNIEDDQTNNLKYFLEAIENYKKQQSNKLGYLSIASLSFPEIQNTSVLIIEHQDYEIASKAKDSINKLPWIVFNKYSYIQTKKQYANLSDQDLVILKTLDKIIDRKEQCSNLYSRKNFKGKANEKVVISFQIKNPLNTPIKITSMKLMCNFKPHLHQSQESTDMIEEYSEQEQLNTIEYQMIQMILPPDSTKDIELYFRPLVPGKCIIKGVSINLSPNAEIKHYFNKKKLSKLYSYWDCRNRNSSFDNGRSSTASSHNSMLLSTIPDFSHRRATIFNRKGDLIYESLDNSSDLVITFPKGQSFEMYCNELSFIPIIIDNNTNHKIKRFSIFIAFSYKIEKQNNSNVRDNIYKEIDLYKNNKKTEILIPFIPLSKIKYTVNIVLKFEDESKFKQIDIQRFCIDINVKKSIRFAFDEEIISIDVENNNTEKCSKFNLKTFAFIENDSMLSNLRIGSIVHNCNIQMSEKHKSDWKLLSDKNNNKLYSIQQYVYCLKNKVNNKIKSKSSPIYEGKSLDCLTEEVNAAQPHIQKKINSLITNRQILFNWKATDKEGNDVNGIYIYKLILNKPELSLSYLQTLISHSIIFNIKQIQLSSEETIVTINLLLQKRGLFEFDSIKNYMFKIDDSNRGFTWFGLESKIITNVKDIKDIEVKLSFTFITKLKGEMNINKISMLFYKNKSYNPQLIPIYTLKEVPYPIIVTID